MMREEVMGRDQGLPSTAQLFNCSTARHGLMPGAALSQVLFRIATAQSFTQSFCPVFRPVFMPSLPSSHFDQTFLMLFAVISISNLSANDGNWEREKESDI